MQKSAAMYRFSVFTYTPKEGVLRKKGRPVSLSYQPSKLLELLIMRQGEIVTREEIKKYLWEEDTFIAWDVSINTCVRSLRSALGDDASKPQFIETIPRRGYRFICPVKEGAPIHKRVLVAVLPRLVVAAGTRRRGIREC
jgi:DNA-binding winged helix-turn-helix (wHTH) protein